MKSKLWALGAALALLSPGSALGLSFGTFQAGEMITSIKLSETTVTYSGGTLEIDGWVSEINTTLGSYTPGNNDVVFNSQIALVSESNLPPSFVTASFDAAGADLTILDLGMGGPVNPLIYAANFSAPLTFSASQPSTEVTGTVEADFTTRAGDGDAGFEAAMGSVGDLFGNLSNFTVDDDPISGVGDLAPVCPIPLVVCPLGDFAANTTITIDPPVVAAPEPAAMVLLGSALAALAIRSRRS